MTTNNARPLFLNLFQIRLQVAGLLSITHRATGVLLALTLPALILLLEQSLSGVDGFNASRALLQSPLGKAGLFFALWALFHHLMAGIRYLLIDMGIGVERPAFRVSALLVLLAAPLIANHVAGSYL